MGHVETLLAIMDGKTAWTHEEYMFAARLRGHAARRMNHQLAKGIADPQNPRNPDYARTKAPRGWDTVNG
jgi:hypothetical protein